MSPCEHPNCELAPIFIISGGAGALGKHVARVALSQFPGCCPEVIVVPQIGSAEQLGEAIEQVAARGGSIVIPELRRAFDYLDELLSTDSADS